MFKLFRKKDGKIEHKCSWMSIENIACGLDQEELNKTTVLSALCQLSIFGGLDLKRNLCEKKILKNADSDQIIIEGACFTRSQVFKALHNRKNIDLYEIDSLAEIAHTYKPMLFSILGEISEKNIPKNFASAYHSVDLIEGSGILSGRLTALNNANNPEINLVMPIAVSIYCSTILPAIIDYSVNLLKVYSDVAER